MSDDHTARAAALESRLSSVQMEIDDDDEDVIVDDNKYEDDER